MFDDFYIEFGDRVKYDWKPADYISLDSLAYTINDIGRRLDELERKVSSLLK
jgi:hypothetical protein